MDLPGYDLDGGDAASVDGSDGNARHVAGGDDAVEITGRRQVDGVSVCVRVHRTDPGSEERLAGLARLKGRHGLVPILDVGRTSDGWDYVVTERWPTPTLADRLRAGAIGPADVTAIGRVVAQALAGAHDAGVVHGSLQPADITFTPAGHPRLDGLRPSSDGPPGQDLTALGDVLRRCLAAPDGQRPRRRGDVPEDLVAVVERASSGGYLDAALAMVSDLDDLADRYGWTATRLSDGRNRLRDRGASARARRARSHLRGPARDGGAAAPAAAQDVDDGAASHPEDLADQAPQPAAATEPRRWRMIGLGVAGAVAVVLLGSAAVVALGNSDGSDPAAGTTAAGTADDATPRGTSDTLAAASGEPERPVWIVEPDGSVVDALTGIPVAGGVETRVVDVIDNRQGTGGWQLLADGTIRAFGAAEPVGSGQLLLTPDEEPTLLIAGEADDQVLVVLDSGRVVPVGGASQFGDPSQLELDSPLVDGVRSAGGMGYVLLSAAGDLYAFGDADSDRSARDFLEAPAMGLVGIDDGFIVIAADGRSVRLSSDPATGAEVATPGEVGALTTPLRSVRQAGDRVVVVDADGAVTVVPVAELAPTASAAGAG